MFPPTTRATHNSPGTTDHPGDTGLGDRAHAYPDRSIRVPILPLLASGVPPLVITPFERGRRSARPRWFAQADKVRNASADLAAVAQMAELVPAGRCSLRPGPVARRCRKSLGGIRETGRHEPAYRLVQPHWRPADRPVAGFVVDSWTETSPKRGRHRRRGALRPAVGDRAARRAAAGYAR